MSTAEVLDFDPRDRGERPLANMDAEHGVLGVALCDNGFVAELDGLEARHFAEGAHARLWLTITDLVGAQQIADPVTVAQRLNGDPGLTEFGGLVFLADLVDKAPGRGVATQYARMMRDLATARDLIRLADMATSAVRKGEPAASALSGLESGLLALRTGQGRAELATAAEGAAGVLADLDAPESADGGISTGLEPLDEHLGQLLPDDLVLVAGRPGMGKSAIGACIALNVSERGIGVIEINSEMTVKQMMRRHLTDLCFGRWGRDAPTYKDIRRRRVSPGQRGMLEWAAEQASALPLAMVKRTGLTVSALRSLAKRQAALWEARGIRLGLVTVDHVGLLKADGGGKDRYTDQTDIAIGMKALADELHVPVIALVQLNREVEKRDGRKPQLSDLRDTGAWEENADTVIGMYRDAYYANKEDEPKLDGSDKAAEKWALWHERRRSPTLEAVLLKVREGEEGLVKLWASIGHNAIRGDDPQAAGGFL